MKNLTNMIIVGAGLAGLITAWRCLHSNPDLKVTIITQDSVIGGNQIWSFNREDILPELAEWVEPFIVNKWDYYDVGFPKKNRRLNIDYCSSNSDALRACVQPYIDAGRLIVKYETTVKEMNLQTVTLEDGQVLQSHYVIDARGFEPRLGVIHAYKNIVGQVISTQKPHGLVCPIVMDANIQQTNGFEYMYSLPLSEYEVLIEHICYSEEKTLNAAKSTQCIKEYAKSKKWTVEEITHQKTGILPVTLASNMNPEHIDIEETSQATKVGMRCGYYHAVTGYSFAENLKSALVIDEYIQADIGNFARGAAREMNQHEIDHFREERFMRLFNRMFFYAMKPSQRYTMFELIYNQSEAFIARFYRGRMERNDKLRLLATKSPFRVLKILKYAKDRSLFKAKE